MLNFCKSVFGSEELAEKSEVPGTANHVRRVKLRYSMKEKERRGWMVMILLESVYGTLIETCRFTKIRQNFG